MPGASIARPTTTKTEFARYLNERGETVPILRDQYFDYRKTPHRLNTFGIWLRVQHERKFRMAYETWWLHRPQLFGVVYEESAGN